MDIQVIEKNVTVAWSNNVGIYKNKWMIGVEYIKE